MSWHFPLPGSSKRIKEARATLPLCHKSGGTKVNKLYSCLGVFLLFLLVPLFPAWSSERTPGPGSEITPKTIPAPAPSPAKPSWEDHWKSVVEAAKKEGDLRIYSSIAPEARTEVQNGFRDKFGIKVEFVTGLPADLVAKVLRERRANLYLADLFVEGSSVQIVNLKSEGIIEPLEPFLILPEVKDSKVWQAGHVPYLDKDKLAISFVASHAPRILRNTKVVKAGEITSYMDLLKPQWKGKVVMSDPTIPGPMATFCTMLAAHIWDLTRTKEYLQGLARQEPFITRDNRLMLEWVAREKYALCLGARPEIAASFWSAGAPIEVVRATEGRIVSPGSGCISLAKNAPHPKSAQVFLNWLLSHEGQVVFSRGSSMPSARVDVPTTGITPMLLAEPGEKVFLETEDDILLRAKMMEITKEIMASLLK